MELFNFIRIERSRCVKCLQCLRSCDVNAIRYVDNELVIIPNRCVKCGKCFERCPIGAVEVKHYLRSAQRTVMENEVVVASITPTWVSEFKQVHMSQLVAALKKLGFTHVSQTVHGATKVIEETRKNLGGAKPLVISSLCPVVNKLIEMYYPHFIEYLNPISTPETIHSRMIKKWYGEGAKTIFIGSCLAVKGNKNIDAAITFSALKDWLQEEGIDIYSLPIDPKVTFEPFLAHANHGYQLVSSAIEYFPQADVQSASGLVRVKKMLGDIDVDKIEDTIYLELFACEGGCLTSVGSIDKNNMLAKKLLFDKHIRNSRQEGQTELPEVACGRKRTAAPVENSVSEEKIEAVLRTMNISQSGSLLNCGACGYDTCNDFANAVVLDMAEIRTCVWHQKNILSQNFKQIIEVIPSGFFMINRKMRILNANKTFCDIIGFAPDLVCNPHTDTQKIIPFHDLIGQLFESDQSEKETEVEILGKKMKLKLFTIQEGNLICGTVRNIFASAAYDDTYIQMVKSVVRDNLASVQKIAALLGENVSRTESILTAVLEPDKQ